MRTPSDEAPGAAGSLGSVASDAPEPPGIDRERARGWRRAGSAPRRPCRCSRSRGSSGRGAGCAVEETGMNSVRPSTTPRTRASMIVFRSMNVPRRLVGRIALFPPRAGSIPERSPAQIRRPHSRSTTEPRPYRIPPPDASSSSPSAFRRFPLRPPAPRRVRRGRSTLVEEPPWERREELLALNPAGTLPVLVDDDDGVDRRRGGHRRISRRDARRRGSARAR